MLREDSMNSGITDPYVFPALRELVGHKIEETHEYRSRYSYKALMDNAENYFLTKPSQGKPMTSGIRLANRKFAPHLSKKLVALNLDDPAFIEKSGIKLDKSAGLTEYGVHKEAALGLGFMYARKILSGKKAPHACLAGARTQNTKIVDRDGHLRPKTRLIWMYPLEMTILESMIARPLINFYLHRSSPMLFGKTSSFKSTEFVHHMNTTRYTVATDQSSFDQCCRAQDIHACFNCWRKLFDLDQVIDQDGHTVRKLFDVVERYFIYTPLVYPSEEGPQITRDKVYGVPSGSYFTQMVDSYINYALTVQLFDDLHVHCSPSAIYVLGDDMIAFSHSFVSVQAMHDRAEVYGYKIHTDEKSKVRRTRDREFEFLGVVWREGVPVRNIQDVIDHALYPERFRNYKEKEQDPLRAAANTVYSYGLTAEIQGVNWSRKKLVDVASSYLSGYLKYLVEELPGYYSHVPVVSKVY